MLSAPAANQKPKLLFPALGLSVPAHLEGPSRPWGGGFSWGHLLLRSSPRGCHGAAGGSG